MTTDPLAPLRSPGWLAEARRKAIHLSTIVLPFGMLYEWLPWPRGRPEWRWLLIGLTLAAIAIDLVRIHERRVREFFRAFFGEMIRDHEQLSLLGSTYLLIAALLAIEMFPWPVAAAALGFTIVVDGLAALVGRASARASKGRSAACWGACCGRRSSPSPDTSPGRSRSAARWRQVWSRSCRYLSTTTSESRCSPDT